MVDFEIVIRAANAIMNGCGESGKCRGGEEVLVALIFCFSCRIVWLVVVAVVVVFLPIQTFCAKSSLC